MHDGIWLIIPLLSFILQSYPRFFNKYFGIDVWTRLIEIDHVKKAGHKIPGKIKNGFIIQGYFDYPIIFPWIFSFFPKKTLLNFQGFIAPIFDSLQNILVFFITLSLFHNVYTSLVAQLIYTLTPILPIENSYLTPRSLGYLNFTLAFYPLLLYSINHQPIYILLGFFFTVLLFLSHRFALQAFVFLSIFFSVVDFSSLYIVNVLLAFLTVVFITQGYYLRVLKGHLANIYFWVINKQFRFAHQIYGAKRNTKKDWVSNIYGLLSLFSPIFMIIINCWIISAGIYVYLVFAHRLGFNPLYYKMSLWVIFFYLFGVVVLKVKHLIPIGEGQRYLEMATVPSAILSSYLLTYFFNHSKILTTVVFIVILAINLCMILFIQVKGIIKDKNRSLTEDLKNTFNFINTLPKKKRVMCIPHGITTMTVYNTSADVLVNADNPGLLRLTGFFPILRDPLRKVVDRFKINYILIQENFAKIKDLQMKGVKIVFRSHDVVLLKVS